MVAWILGTIIVASAAAADAIPNGLDAFAPTPSKPKTTVSDAMPNGTGVFAPRSIKAMTAEELANEIDRLVELKWKEMGANPTPRSSDAEFLRRVYLDLAGRIPSVAEVRAFLEDQDPQKRSKAVVKLLAGPGFVNHMMNLYRELLLPEARGSQLIRFFEPGFDAWLRVRLRSNAPYDEMVREILTVSATEARPVFNNPSADAKLNPSAYVAAKDGKPENLAAGVSRVFLGIRLECAQCHNHPFAKWKREEFWGMASFFAGIDRRGNGDSIFQGTEVNNKSELKIPGTQTTVQATFLDGGRPTLVSSKSPRLALAEWVTSPDNPYFARATANRVWSQFFGVGIVDPVDDLGGGSEPSHPELLDTMADQFAANKFDLRYLSRAIASSKTYQLSSIGGSPSSDAYRLFDRMPVRGLTALQLYDSLVMAAGLQKEADQGPFVINSNSPKGEFLERFAAPEEKPTDRQTSILQALTLLNGAMVDQATSLSRGKTLPAIADSYFLDTPAKIEALYLAALGRKPRPDELERLVPYVERGGTTLDPKKALADVFWSLFGSAEFVFNH